MNKKPFMNIEGHQRGSVNNVKPEVQVLVQRKKAFFSSWYEIFPRSTSPHPRLLASVLEL